MALELQAVVVVVVVVVAAVAVTLVRVSNQDPLRSKGRSDRCWYNKAWIRVEIYV